MLSRFRLAVRIQRFEVWSCVLIVAVVGITALIVRARLDGVGAPVECLTPWVFEGIVYDAARCDPLAKAFFQINQDEAEVVMTAMGLLPLVVGLVLGVGLVGREIEGGTAATVWALAGSRRRWLLGRLVPILVILVAVLAFAAIASDILAAARVPWQLGRPAFDDAGRHGPGVIARGLAAFGLALAIGARYGQMLPTILLSSLLALFLVAGGWGLRETWVEANAHEIAVPFWFNGWYDGGEFVGYTSYLLPDGRLIENFQGSVDVLSLAPAGVDPEVWVAEEVRTIAHGVHSPDYPAWLVTEVAAFGAFGLAWLAATFVIVERRRPF
jgi:ABC-2 family transporter protein